MSVDDLIRELKILGDYYPIARRGAEEIERLRREMNDAADRLDAIAAEIEATS